MKVIRIDNFDREYYPDVLVADGLSKEEAEMLAKEENKGCHSEEHYFKVVEDNYKMFGGFEP